MALDIEDAKQVVEKNSNTKSAGKSSLRLDAQVVSEVKQEVGVAQNTELAPFVEAVLLDSIGEGERANERLEEFKAQFISEE